MKKILKQALEACKKDAAGWAAKFNDGTATRHFPRSFAGEKTLRRAGREDLIPALRRRVEKLSAVGAEYL